MDNFIGTSRDARSSRMSHRVCAYVVAYLVFPLSIFGIEHFAPNNIAISMLRKVMVTSEVELRKSSQLQNSIK